MRHKKERELDSRMSVLGMCFLGAAAAVVSIGTGLFGDDNGAEGAADASAAGSRQAAENGRVQTAMAQDLFDFHKANYRPVEQAFISDAMKAGSQGEMDTRAGNAGATVAQQFGNARRDLSRNMGQYGLNPNSGKFADMARTSAIDEAAASVGAQNNARQDERKFGMAAKADAAALGRNIPATAMAGMASASASASASANAANNSFNMARQQTADQGTGIAAIAGNMQKIYDGYQAYTAPTVAPNTQATYDADDGYTAMFRKGGLIKPPSKTHGYLKGGRVDGPGTGTSDSVPMMIDGAREGAISSGEYVLNAKATQRIGLKKLDEMNLEGLPAGSKMKDGVHVERVLPRPHQMAA